MDTIYLDFAKAFDSVPHERLLEKVKGYGIRGDIFEWIRLFIKGRRQRVVVNGKKSTWLDVKSGVPQGSVIGPLLFLLFINDMPNEMNCNIQLFADDAKIFKTVDNEEDHQDLAKDLDNLENWARLWQMRFNVGKCKVLHLGSRNPRYDYNMGDLILETATEEKDLGVIIDEKLKFDKHTEAQVNKANKVLGLLRRSFETLDKETLVWLFKALVRPHLEYCNTVTYPVYEKDAKLLESVQRRATKMVPGMNRTEQNRTLYFDREVSVHIYKYIHIQHSYASSNRTLCIN